MKKSLYIFLTALILVGYAFSKQELDRRVQNRKSSQDIRYLPSVRVAKILSFGFLPALADAYWIEAINYFGTELGKKIRNYQYLPAYCDLILGLDPVFNVFYEWAGTVFIYNGLPISPKSVYQATSYVNMGIQHLNEVHRFDSKMLMTGAFNYALELRQPLLSLPYFEMMARIFPDRRDMLLVAATYAGTAKRPDISAELKLEYLGQVAFDVKSKSQLQYALTVLSSPNMNARMGEFLRTLRLAMEKDDDLRDLVKKRLDENPTLDLNSNVSQGVLRDHRLENVLKIDISRTWLPTEMLVLFSL